MNNQRRNFRLTCALLAAVLAVGVAGCAQPAEDKQPQGKTQQLWIADNFVDPQEGYPMENPSAIELSATAALQKNSLLNGQTQKQQQTQEMKAVWLSYLDLKPMLLDKNDKSVGKAQFTKNIQKAFDNIQQLGLNTVIAQVRPFSDALYESELFPWSYLATGEEGADPGFDPLAIMVEQAHQRGLQLHAWVNPYRVRTSATYDPASKKAQQLIVEGVREIVEKYDVDGIHFDDYFYPTTDAGFDSASYQAYKNKGGSLSLAAWRRQNVNDLVKQVYAAVKQADGEVLFGISPQGNMDNNYNKQFIDVKKWLSEEGYLDYICPQVYFGFKNSTCPYEQTVEEWNDLIQNKVQLVVGLSPYKVGLEDAYAGNGRWEWANSGDILARMVETARKEEHYQGFALFRYNSVFQPESSVRPAILEELDSLQEVL